MSGRVTSCGCLVAENNKRRSKHKPGAIYSSEYHTWQAMKDRCHNPRNTKFEYYGGRGINVCERWRNSFSAFYADMGDKPSWCHSIDRIDSTGPYSPENCRWATPSEQARNKTNTRMTTINGIPIGVADLADKHGISNAVVRGRLNYGWSAERAVSVPVRHPRPRALAR